jgi:hypothetical protein
MLLAESRTRTGTMANTNKTPRTLRPSRSLLVTLFLLFGILETLCALVLFQRADDHEYFLSVANFGTAAVLESGVDQYDLKARIAAAVFYGLMSPARWLGGSEIGHLLWLRVIMLIGMLCAFEATRRLLPPAPSDIDVTRARSCFLMLCLLYPGQLAWTASLLRDGPACAFLFIALLAWSSRQRILALISLVLSMALRPEFAAVVMLLTGCSMLFMRLRFQRYRITILLGVLALVSVVAFEPRQAASEFAQYAFASVGAAYPVVAHWLDISGYAMVLVQGLIDPMSLAAPAAMSPFFLAEMLFFVWLIAIGLSRLRYSQLRAAGLIFGLFVALWLFAYFEIYVSGFSRHRLMLVIMMLALITLTRWTMPRRRCSP